MFRRAATSRGQGAHGRVIRVSDNTLCLDRTAHGPPPLSKKTMSDPCAPRPPDPPVSSDEEMEAESRRSTRARKRRTPYSPGKVRSCPTAR